MRWKLSTELEAEYASYIGQQSLDSTASEVWKNAMLSRLGGWEVGLGEAAVAVLQSSPIALRRRIARSRPLAPLRWTVGRLLQGGRVTVPLGGPLRGHRMQLSWKHHIEYALGVYELRTVEAIRRIVHEGWVCVDVGAYIGYFTLLCAKLAGPTGRVVAFEPLERNFRVLQRNVELNRYSNVLLENAAVMEQPGFVSLDLVGEKQVAVVRPESGQCPAVSLDDYCRAAGLAVNFVKIDVEGAEDSVMRGMRRLLRDVRPVVLVELHRRRGEARDHPALEELRKAEYDISHLGTRGLEFHVIAYPRGRAIRSG